MASGTNFRSTLIYAEPLSEESNMHINRNKTYTNDKKVNQYVLQNSCLNNVTLCNNFQLNRIQKLT